MSKSGLSRIFKALSAGALFAFSSLGLATSAAHAEKAGHLVAARASNNPDALVLMWSGPMFAPMAQQIQDAFNQYKDSVKKVELKIDSGGGSVKEGEKVIKILQDIKKTHKLTTAVMAGRKCGSMCVFVYVQGQHRLAASASLWLFHEVSVKDPKTNQITKLDRTGWERLVNAYWVPAGVDQQWIEEMKTHTLGTDYWQSGDSLLRDGAKIILNQLPDEQRRIVRSNQKQADASGTMAK